MFSTSTLLKTAATALALGAAGSALAGAIVVRSSGPSAASYPPGKAVTGSKIALRAGDTVVVLDGNSTRTFSGAGTYTLGASGGGTAPSAIGALIRNTGARQVRTGAVRGTTGPIKAPNLWFVDVSRSGTMCIAEPGRATLWRAGMDQPATLTLTRVSDGKSTPLALAAGQAMRPWPTAELPLVEGAEYKISWPGMAKATSVRFAVVNLAGSELDGLGAALIGKGCTAQLDMLVDTATRATAAPAAS